MAATAAAVAATAAAVTTDSRRGRSAVAFVALLSWQVAAGADPAIGEGNRRQAS